MKNNQKKERTSIAKMFDNIAWRYDFLNHFLSFNIDKRWRNKAVNELRNITTLNHVLDVATGTADLALAIQKHINPKHITGIDISEGMLTIGRQKVQKRGLEHQISLLYADSEALPFDEQTFDAVTVAFGVRNFENLEKGLNEMCRTLKIGGKVVILEFSIPQNRIIRPVFQFYFLRILPFFGRLLSKNPSPALPEGEGVNYVNAYQYLPESVQSFPHGTEFKEIMEKCGFSEVRIKPLTFGIVNIYTGMRGEK